MFTYSNYDVSQQVSCSGDFHAELGFNIGSVAELFIELIRALHLPNYFGKNWNALSDCLRDLDWIDQCRVILVHHDLPLLSEQDLFQYLDVLREAISDWSGDERHTLEVVFPKATRTTIERILLSK